MQHLLEIQGYNRRGGSERHTGILARGLGDLGWRITVAAPAGGCLDDSGALGRAGRLTVPLSGRFDLSSVAGIAGFCRREGVDLIHTHCRNADFLGGLAQRMARVPALATTLHGMLRGPQGEDGGGVADRVHRELLRRWPHRLIGISQAVTERARRVLGPARVPITTVLNGSEPPTDEQVLESRRLRQRLLAGPEEVLIVQAGSLEPSKDPLTLLEATIRAARRGIPLRLLFVGSGSLEERLRTEARAAGMADRVVFAGEVPDAGPHLGAADVVCLASRWEGFGRVLVEGMSYGRPVAASRVDGIPEVVEDGETGLLVEPARVEAWTAALIRLAGDRGLRERLGAAGRRRFETRFGVDRFVRETDAVLRSVLAPGPAARSRREETRAAA